MKYFITGGAGFIGSHLADRLLSESRDNQVTVFDNLTSGSVTFIEHHLGDRRFSFIKGDVLDFDTLRNAMKGHDVVFHLAANGDIQQGFHDTKLHLQQGTLATYNVLEAMRLNDIRRIVFSSSATVYGETFSGPVSETNGPLLPISLYGAAKLSAEGLISAFCGTFGIQAWIYRFANIVGSRMTHGVIYDFIRKLSANPTELLILGDGRQRKPFVHVSECVDAFLFGFRKAQEPINLFNIGCVTVTEVNRIAQMVVEEMGLQNVRFTYTGGERGWPGDVPRLRFDISRLQRLGWEPSLTSDEAVRRAIRDMLGKKP